MGGGCVCVCVCVCVCQEIDALQSEIERLGSWLISRTGLEEERETQEDIDGEEDVCVLVCASMCACECVYSMYTV